MIPVKPDLRGLSPGCGANFGESPSAGVDPTAHEPDRSFD
jgi:hypothetical protein